MAAAPAALEGMTLKYKLNIGETTPLSPAMKACLSLVALYYAMFLLAFFAGLRKSLAAAAKGQALTNEAEAGDNTSETTEGAAEKQSMAQKTEAFMTKVADESRETMIIVPMLTVLIVFARLRAKVDLEGTNPPEYARQAFFGATALIYIMAFQKVVFQIISSFVGDNMQAMITKLAAVLSFLCTLGVYGCIVAIFYSICDLTKTAAE